MRGRLHAGDKGGRRAALLTPQIIWSSLFVIVPMIFVLYYTFTKDGHFTFENITYMLDPENNYLKSFGQSIMYALGATAICLVVGYPVALFVSRLNERRRRLVLMLIMLPMWVNFIIRTYTILNIFERTGIVNNLLGKLGFGPVTFVGTPGLIIFGMVYDFLPYMVVPICNVLSGIDKKYLEAASDLGCNSLQVFGKVLFPLSISGIISGVTMVFVPSISTFYIASKLSSGKVTLIGDKIESAFLSNASKENYGIGSALSFVLMIMILISVFVMNKFGDKSSEDVRI